MKLYAQIDNALNHGRVVERFYLRDDATERIPAGFTHLIDGMGEYREMAVGTSAYFTGQTVLRRYQ